MRRATSYGSIAIGVALLILAPVFRWVVPGVAVRDPGKVNQQLFLRGTGDFWFVSRQQQKAVDDVPIQVSRYITTACQSSDATKSKTTTTCPSGDVSDGRTAVWDQRVEYSATLPDGSTASIQVDLDRVAFDRSNGRAVGGYGQPYDHGGAQVFFFPFHTKKQTYQLWDVADYRPEPAVFVKETTYAGLAAYEFRQSPARDLGNLSPDGTVPSTWLGLPAGTSVPAHKIYTNTRDVFVEPRTGTILGETDDTTITARALDGRGTPLVLLQVHDFQTAEASRNYLAGKANDARRQLTRLTVTVPLGCVVIGLLALTLGIALVEPGGGGRSRRSPTDGVTPPSRSASVHQA